MQQQPRILTSRDPRRGQIVAAVNLAGRRAGVRPGMRLSEATALVPAEIHVHDPQQDLEELCALAEEAQQFSPLVGLEPLDKKIWAGRSLHQPEALLLDVSGIAGLFGGEVELLQAVCQWLQGQRCFGCVALAGTPGAAWALANYQLRQSSSSTNSAAGDLPACRYHRGPLAGDASAIAGLPLAALRLPAETVFALSRLGIRQIGQLEQLPRGGLATRLGEHLLTRWDQATGRCCEPILGLHAAPDWSLQHTLEYPISDRSTLQELVRRLTGQLAERLGRRGEGVLRIVCRVDWVDLPPLVMQLGLYRPNSDADHLQLLMLGQLEQQLRRLTSRGGPPALWRVSLQATLTAQLIWRQSELFAGGEEEAGQQLARLIDRLSSRLGRQQVLAAQVHREAPPELSFSFQPLTGRRPDGRPQDSYRKLSSRLARHRGEPSRDDPQRRPTQLFAPPRPIQVAVADSPSPVSPTLAAQAGRSPLPPLPTRLCLQGRWLEVSAATGPERLESGWWRGPSLRRDYYRVATQGGGWWWIYRDLTNGHWFLHGAFD